MNLYGRARRLALYRNIGITISCIIAIAILIVVIFSNRDETTVSSEFDLLRDHFVNRGFTCEMLNVSGSRCIFTADSAKTTFYRFDDGFEYIVKTNSYTLTIVHRLNKEDKLTFKTTSSAFDGYKNQNFICTYEKNVLGKVEKCEAVDEYVILDVQSYLGIIEQAQVDILNAINSSGYSLDGLLSNYEWIKK